MPKSLIVVLFISAFLIIASFVYAKIKKDKKTGKTVKHIDFQKANKLDEEHEKVYGKLNLPSPREDYEQIKFTEIFNETDDHFLYVSDLHIIHKIELDFPEDKFPLKKKNYVSI